MIETPDKSVEPKAPSIIQSVEDYRFLHRPITSFHLEITSKCTLACPRCPRTIYKGKYKAEDLPVELIRSRFTKEILDPVKYIVFCGDHGDPIYHAKFHDVIEYFKSHNKKLTINTNASRRKREWWEKTASILTKRDDLKFSIDGLEDTNHLYRVKSQWKDIMDAVDVCRGNVRMIWKFIVFKHNQHQIHQAEKLAEKLGFDQFDIVRSHLFGKDWLEEGQTEDPLMPDAEWLDPKYFNGNELKVKKSAPIKAFHRLRELPGFKQIKFGIDKLGFKNSKVEALAREALKQAQESKEIKESKEKQIYAKCKFGEVHYVNAHGHYLPCCWSGNYDLFKHSSFDVDQNYYDLADHSFEEILRSEGLKKLEKSWSSIYSAPRVCRIHCAGHSPPDGWEHSYDVEKRDIKFDH